ncbi:MAG: regulator of protease activity HflC (stomatin/prohibitin superfamily) [Chlamydiales bacterium]|jgi:regulator of protease activity HflC (stomatin/prohibitin superfamily)
MGKTIDVGGWPPEGGPKPTKKTGGGQRPPILVTIAAAMFGMLLLIGTLMALSGKLGIATIEAEEVGIVVNYLTGNEEVITQPGYKIYIPFIEEVFTFDRTTQLFTMKGRKHVSANHVPHLDVRANDGSNFRFDELTILYEVIPGETSTVLNDSGPGSAFKDEWIKAHARSILRDEFGRYSAVEVANPTVYQAAPNEAKRRINALIEPHGIRIERINTPNPKFDDSYEAAIEERKEADQEVERLIAEAQRLDQLRAQRLAGVSKEKEVEQQNLQGDLRRSLLGAQERFIAARKSADVYATERAGRGEAERSKLTAQARGLEAKYTKEAEGIAEKARALEQRGQVVVREAIIQKLRDITFTLVPYSRDPMPKRLEHMDARGKDTMIDETSMNGGN